MPSDAVHIIFNFIIFALISILHVKYPVLSLAQYAIFTLFFIIGTLVLNPDLDTKSEASRRCGLLCKPLRKITKHGGICHKWAIGTIVILIYVFVILAIGVIIIFGIDGLISLIKQALSHKAEIISGAGGVFIANFLHLLLDRMR